MMDHFLGLAASIGYGNFSNIATLINAIPAPRSILGGLVASLTIFPTLVRGKGVVNLVVDTDLFSDVDDAAALLLACTLPEANLLAVNVNVNSTYSALAASAILNHYNCGNVPIGLPRPYANTSFFDTWAFEYGEYSSKVAYRWSGGSVAWFDMEKTWDPVQLYRKTLAEADDKSITIASVGFLENLSRLLNSTADEYSSSNGYDLVEAKVAKLAVMGGEYPAGYEFNFWGANASHTAHVVNTWPSSVPVTFLGLELGLLVSTGARLSVSGPDNDPVKAAYQWYVGYNRSRFSWDPLTVVYAVRGLGDWFEYGDVDGYNFVFPNGSNTWVQGEERNQRYLQLKTGNETVARELDDFYLSGMQKLS